MYKQMLKRIFPNNSGLVEHVNSQCIYLENYWQKAMPKSTDGSLPEIDNDLKALIVAFTVSNYFEKVGRC